MSFYFFERLEERSKSSTSISDSSRVLLFEAAAAVTVEEERFGAAVDAFGVDATDKGTTVAATDIGVALH